MDIRRKKIIKSSVFESVEKLLELARLEYSKPNHGRSNRYVEMAFELIKKNRLRLPKNLKNSFCKKCYSIWLPTQSVRLWYDMNNSCLRLSCMGCESSKRF